MESDQWAIGDAVVVKAGVKAPDTGDEIGRGQGRISTIQAGEPLILTIHGDSVTLKSLPATFIGYSVEEGLSWTEMNLEPQAVTHTPPAIRSRRWPPPAPPSSPAIAGAG
jgi:hypothetical protein